MGASITVIYAKIINADKISPVDTNFKLETADGTPLKLLGYDNNLRNRVNTVNCCIIDKLYSPILIVIFSFKKIKNYYTFL